MTNYKVSKDPNTQVYADFMRTFEEKVVYFDLVEELFGEYKETSNYEGQLYYLLKDWFERAAKPGAVLSDFYHSDGNFYYDKKEKIVGFSLWMIDSGFTGFSYKDQQYQESVDYWLKDIATRTFSARPNPSNYIDVIRKIEKNNEVPPVKPDPVEDKSKLTVFNNIFELQDIAMELVGEKAYSGNYADFVYITIPQSFLNQAETAKSLSAISQSYNVYPHYSTSVEEVKKYITEPIVQWLKDSGYTNAYADAMKTEEDIFIKFYADYA